MTRDIYGTPLSARLWRESEEHRLERTAGALAALHRVVELMTADMLCVEAIAMAILEINETEGET